MVTYFSDCEEYAKNILQRIPILRTKQLAKALYKLSAYVSGEEEALIFLHKIQRRGYLFMSPDGFTLSRGAYSMAANDRLLTTVDYANGQFAIPDIGPTLYKKNLITSATDCFWIVCDFLPYSYEFIANLTPPWSVCFDVKGSDGKNRVYQVMKIKKGDAYQTAMILKSLPQVPKEVQSNIIRIALLEDPREKDVIPAAGFKFLCTIDERKRRGYTIIEKREGNEIWG